MEADFFQDTVCLFFTQSLSKVHYLTTGPDKGCQNVDITVTRLADGDL